VGALALSLIKQLKQKAFGSEQKVSILDPDKANATLGVTAEIIRTFVESREKAARLNVNICPLCVEDLKWGID